VSELLGVWGSAGHAVVPFFGEGVCRPWLRTAVDGYS
jgi:hypothetical protein